MEVQKQLPTGNPDVTDLCFQMAEAIVGATVFCSSCFGFMVAFSSEESGSTQKIKEEVEEKERKNKPRV